MMKKLLTVALLTLTAAVGASIKGEAPKSFGATCSHDYLVNYQQSWRALQLLKGKKSATMNTVLGSEYNDYGHSLTNALILREWV